MCFYDFELLFGFFLFACLYDNTTGEISTEMNWDWRSVIPLRLFLPYSLILKQYLLAYVALTIKKRSLPVQSPFASFYIFGHFDFAEILSKL